MAMTQGSKAKLLYLMDILLRQTDERHVMNANELVRALAAYGIRAERKSIYSDIALLNGYGLDVQQSASPSGYFIGERAFELAELKLLADAVQSSRFITAGKSRALIKKLTALTSQGQARQLDRQVHVAERPKAMNESVFYNIDAVHAAIAEEKKVCFRYFDYDMEKQKVYRREGCAYVQTPVALFWNEDSYYLIAYNARRDSLVHYRVDRMTDVQMDEEPADAVDRARFNPADYSKKVFGMYGGKRLLACLRFDESLVNVVLDRFGEGVVLYRRQNGFEIHVEVSDSPVFLAWIFQFGGRAEIVSPAELRDSMRGLMEQNAVLYKL